jgi:transcriptional antiterminator RfaH
MAAAMKSDSVSGAAMVRSAPLSGPRWCVCQSHQHQERLALENLERQAFEVYLPLMLTELKLRGRPARIISKPLLPGYLFVRVDLANDQWRRLYGTRGVAAVIGGSARPSLMNAQSERLVAEIRAREEDGYIRIKPADPICQFKQGDKVTWNGLLEATFHEMVDSRRVRIFFCLLGTETSQVVDLSTLS